ncbi:DEAD/DEAH box helicase [Rhizobium sp. KVB221]|uniref:DEAD/DEAH box helicase n=1 Tax=Rhizobium setariae TaxID=2801340 RepID=A0A936YX16_9HYPH|nr:DEAD/DEAH box helicase [Rhizobium setariae]MBL0375390.1 DEAD/DEAH box helicase [Rhizobium setariae]
MDMKLERDGTKGWKAITTYSDTVGRALVKRAGFAWDPARSVWSTSSARSAETLLGFLEDEIAFEIDAGVAEEIRTAAIAEQQTKEAAVLASRAVSTDIVVPAPPGLEYLPYQRAGIAYLGDRLANGPGGALLADEMGLGKTIQVIGLINVMLAEPGRSRVRTLVIAPKIALINWKRELEKWLVQPHSIAIWTTSSTPDADIVIVNYDIVSKLDLTGSASPWDLLVCDESQALKDSKAARTRAVLGGKGQPAIPARRRLFVTGTPILNRPIELFPILRNCGADFAQNFYAFARRYCAGHETRFGFDATGASNLTELQEKLRASVMVRRLKSEVLSELPDKRRQIVAIDPDQSVALRRALREETMTLKKLAKDEAALNAAAVRAEKSSDALAYDEAIERLSACRAQNLATITRLRQQTALAKVPQVIESVTTMLESVPEAVLVFAHHRDVIDKLADGFRAAGYEPAIISGQTSTEDRLRAQDDIQEGRKRVFIGSIQACGVAITLTAASTVVFAEFDWTPGRMVQAEDRAHRIGQKNAVVVQYHVVDGSIDADMLKQSWSKALDAACALDNTHEPSTERPAPVRIKMDTPALDPVNDIGGRAENLADLGC